METRLTPEIEESLSRRWEPVYRSQLHYLVTWGTRGRRQALRERHVRALHDLVRQACDERGITLVEIAAAADHVHVLIALRPTQSVASAVRELKGRTGVALLAEFPELRVWLRGNLTWDDRYTVETVSGARVAHVRDRLHDLHGPREELAAAS